MSAFFIGAGILMALVILVLLYPLLRRDAGETPVARARINARVYRDQLAELEIDRANGIIDPAACEQSRRELERRALQDIGEESEPPPRMTRWPAIVLVAVIPFAAILTYAALGKPSAMLDRVDEHAATVEKIQRMVVELAARMEKNPADQKGWLMLARSYKALNRIPESIQAFERAGAALDENPQYLVDFAEVVALADKENFQKRGEPLIARALKIDPDHIPALVFAGSAAFEHGDFKAASRHWNKALTRLAPDSDEAKAITEAISRADANAGQGKTAAKSSPGSAEKSAPTAAAAGTGVSGIIVIDPSLAAKAAPEDTVFVFARAAEGPRAPLAVVRARVRDLPFKFALDDTQAMSPELKISRFKRIRVEARVSKSGGAAPQSGDLQGASGIVATGASNLRITIDSLVP